MVHSENKSILLISMPFAGVNIPSIQLQLLETYLKERNINIKTRHLYLKAADFFNLNIYNSLIYPPNDSYTAQIIFSKYVFPDNWNQKKVDFIKYFNEKISNSTNERCEFDFEKYEKITDDFYNWFFENVDWQNYDIIGFTLNYGQFLPSLAIAKKIKELDPNKIIVLGGSRTVGDLGIRTMESFEYIDFIVSGDGEEALYLLASDFENYRSISSLIYREKDNIIFNETEKIIDLNILPIINYDQFFIELASSSDEVRQYFYYYGRLPIEISRGCWWNKCSFCNMNIQHKKYREKNVDKIVDEIQFLSDKYKMLNFQIISNTLLLNNYSELLKKIRSLDKDFNFVAEARAGRLTSDDYTLMKNAGFRIIQTGIESLSSNYLNKMNKGVKIIDNIAALKFCMENSIKNFYNLIINYPNEEPIDFQQTCQTIESIKQYIDPPNICRLRVVYNSPIFSNYEKFNIKNLSSTEIDKIMFPKEILEKQFNFVYEYETIETPTKSKWEELIDNWRNERKRFLDTSIKTQMDTDRFVFYFVDGGQFIKIYDKRALTSLNVYVLDKLEREIFLYCINVRSFADLKSNFSDASEEEIQNILDSFEQSRLIFREEDYYLSLPLNYRKLIGKNEEKIQANKKESMIVK